VKKPGKVRPQKSRKKARPRSGAGRTTRAVPGTVAVFARSASKRRPHAAQAAVSVPDREDRLVLALLLAPFLIVALSLAGERLARQIMSAAPPLITAAQPPRSALPPPARHPPTVVSLQRPAPAPAPAEPPAVAPREPVPLPALALLVEPPLPALALLMEPASPPLPELALIVQPPLPALALLVQPPPPPLPELALIVQPPLLALALLMEPPPPPLPELALVVEPPLPGLALLMEPPPPPLPELALVVAPRLPSLAPLLAPPPPPLAVCRAEKPDPPPPLLARSRMPVTPAEQAAFGRALSDAARTQLDTLVVYNPKYVRIAYPMGDVAPLFGVCTDVIVRAYRALGIDFQQLVQQTRSGTGDRNIDHRRVEVMRRFLARHGTMLPITDLGEDYQPGDIVTYHRPQNRTTTGHIAIVTDRIAPSGRPMIVHNRGWGPQLEDALFVDRITGHFRFTGLPPAASSGTPSAARRVTKEASNARGPRVQPVRQ
jgi:uncharacterized protein YijF (DUF1287 family)